MFNDEADYDDSINEIQKNVDYITKSHLRNVMQLAIFYTGSNKIYAVNISKIQSFVIKESVEIIKTPSSDELVQGVINLRGEVISVVNLDYWIEEPVKEDVYKIIIICNFNERTIGILVKDIIKIEEKNSSQLKLPSSSDPKVSYVTDVLVNDDDEDEQMCIVFDAEKLLYDINKDSDSSGSTIYDIENMGAIQAIESPKLVLVAEDSTTVIEKLHQFFKKVGIHYEIYENGQLLMDRLETLPVEAIGLIVTDIEMPIRNGYQVIKHVKSTPLYEKIPVLSLTSMTNQGVLDKVKQLGAIDLVNKADLKRLHQYIKHYLS